MARGEPLFRQWNLLRAIQSNHFGLTATELAERVECTKRTVQRDLQVLQDVGFPIFYEERGFQCCDLGGVQDPELNELVPQPRRERGKPA